MKIRRSVATRSMIAAASGLLAASAFMVPSANAASAAHASPEAAASVEASLGASSTAGSYYDAATKNMVVNVTSDSAAKAVRAAGATPRFVRFSSAELNKANNAFGKTLDIKGTAWGVDAKANKLVVTADSSVSSADLAKINKFVARYGDAASVKQVDGTFSKLLSGGDPIFADLGWRCSAGFDVRVGSTNYFLTAGHCTEGFPDWYTSSSFTTFIGPTADSSFPGNDYGIVQYAGSVAPTGRVGSVDITRAANPTVGLSVTRRGSTTGIHTGVVQALNQTVNYGGGDIVGGLMQTNVCAEPGDSGGSLYSGSTAIGLTSGGSGNCTFGGTTFFQPVVEALNAYGATIL